VENPPPVIDAIAIPEHAWPWCDKWGNIKKPPEKTIEQCHGADFIKLHIYKTETGFFCFQLKIKKLIAQQEANIINQTPFETED
jgi:hypothetical protein